MIIVASFVAFLYLAGILHVASLKGKVSSLLSLAEDDAFDASPQELRNLQKSQIKDATN